MKEHIPAELLYAVVAGVGGVARYVNRYIGGEAFTWHLLVANVFLSGFSGFMFSLFGRTLGFHGDYLFILAGVGGFMGSSALEFLAKKIKKNT